MHAIYKKGLIVATLKIFGWALCTGYCSDTADTSMEFTLVIEVTLRYIHGLCNIIGYYNDPGDISMHRL